MELYTTTTPADYISGESGPRLDGVYFRVKGRLIFTPNRKDFTGLNMNIGFENA